MNPLEMKGPDFLAFWFGGAVMVAAVTAVAVAVSSRLRERGDVEEVAMGLSAIELGYLEDGTERAVETAIVGLERRGAIVVTVARLGLGKVVPGLSPLETHVLAQLRLGAKTAQAIVDSAGAFGAELRERLTFVGLLRGGSRVSVRWIGYAWLALGAAKVCVGVSRDRPVALLVMMLVAGCFAVRSIKLSRRTHLGDRVLACRAASVGGLRSTAVSAPALLKADEAALAFALFGATGIAGAIVGLLPSHARALAVAQAAASSDGSTCSCSSGGSCGGGCGGGCGGCS